MVVEGWRHRVLVDMLPGQSEDTYQRAVRELAHSLGALDCRVVQADKPGRVWLHLTRADPLRDPIGAFPITEDVDLAAVPIGLREDGGVWTVPVFSEQACHLFVAGVAGAGKGSVFWSLLRGLAAPIRDGLVQVYAIDPKGGVELGPGEKLWSLFSENENPVDSLNILKAAHAQMRANLKVMREGDARMTTLSLERPLILVLIDEITTLLDGSTKTHGAIEQYARDILRQGRAAGVTMVVATQDPRKEFMDFRNLFSRKVGLRLDEPQQVDMVLGPGARAMGAACDRLDEGQQGVGFVRVAGVREPVRVRASWVRDGDIAEQVRGWAPAREVVEVAQAARAARVEVQAPAGRVPLTVEQRKLRWGFINQEAV